nr:MAG TPA: hypothetical protein [Caudoviricetes sp.]
MNTWKTADDVRQVTCSRTLAAELRVRDDVGGWAW